MTVARDLQNLNIARKVGGRRGMSYRSQQKLSAFIAGCLLFFGMAAVSYTFGLIEDLTSILGLPATVWLFWLISSIFCRLQGKVSPQLIVWCLTSGLVSLYAISALFTHNQDGASVGLFVKQMLVLFIPAENMSSITGILLVFVVPGWLLNTNPIGFIWTVIAELSPTGSPSSPAERLGDRKGKGKLKAKPKPRRTTRSLAPLINLINTKHHIVSDVWSADSHLYQVLVFTLADGSEPKQLKARLGSLGTHLGWVEEDIVFDASYAPGHCSFSYPLENPETVAIFPTNDTIIPLAANLKREPINIDLEKSPHFVSVGTSGSGKTTTMHAMLYYFCQLEEGAIFYFCDPKKLGFSAFKTMGSYEETAEGALAQLNNIVDLVEERKDWMAAKGAANLPEYNAMIGTKKLSRVFWMVDEFRSLTDHRLVGKEMAEDIQGKVDFLCREARALGVHLVIGLQDPSRNTMTVDMRGNISTILLHRVRSAAVSTNASGLSGLNAHKLTGNGDMIVVKSDGSTARGRAIFVTPKDIKKVSGQ